MREPQNQLYYRGYIAGYRDGVADAASGRVKNTDKKDFTNLPIRVYLKTRNMPNGEG